MSKRIHPLQGQAVRHALGEGFQPIGDPQPMNYKLTKKQRRAIKQAAKRDKEALGTAPGLAFMLRSPYDDEFSCAEREPIQVLSYKYVGPEGTARGRIPIHDLKELATALALFAQ